MQISRFPFVAHALAVTLIAGCNAHTRSASSSLPARAISATPHPAFAETLKISGVGDVGKISDHLFRSSQPSEKGLEELKSFGITTIVDLRGERHGRIKREKERTEAPGMTFINIHASGWSPPTDAQLVQFFALIQKRPAEKIFVRCWLGDDRTGVFFATYRIAFEHGTPNDAMAEMSYFHFKGFWHPSMKKYILNFPKHFEESPAFAPFRKKSSRSVHPGPADGSGLPSALSAAAPRGKLPFHTTLR